MDTLDAITLLYLSKSWDGQGSLLDCAHTFQQTKDELTKALNEEAGQSLNDALGRGDYQM